ncbi:MAG: exodeoxyribonuclease large subunit [Planctomycetota bacterium]
MARKPFDPGKARGGLFDAAQRLEPTDKPSEPAPLSVSQAAAMLKGTVMGLGKVRVEGEVSAPSKGTHCYFQLKDEDSVVGCVMWGSTLARSSVKPTQGARVVVEGIFDFYAPSGRLSLIAERMRHVGEGDLEAKFRALCDELRIRGYFDEARKRRLPMMPRGVAIITSLGGQALHDCLRTAELRCPWVPLIAVGVPVQGPGSAEVVARAIDEVNRQRERLGIDVIVVTRGGGSREDLQAFNERVVADAAHRSELPVVSAIGHEMDTSVLDLVADHRASTPTQAMMAVLPDRAELAAQLENAADRLRMQAAQLLRQRRQRLQAVATRACLKDARVMLRLPRERLTRAAMQLRQELLAQHRRAESRWTALERRLMACAPMSVLAVGRTRTHDLARRLERLGAGHIERLRVRLEGQRARLESVAPERTLARGYSITLDAQGQPVRDASAVPEGAVLTTRLQHGELRSRTEPKR